MYSSLFEVIIEEYSLIEDIDHGKSKINVNRIKNSILPSTENLYPKVKNLTCLWPDIA